MDLKQLNEELTRLRQDLREQERIQLKLDRSRRLLDAQRAILADLRRRLERRQAEMDRLERPTIKTLFAVLLGRREARLKRERVEFERAKLQLNACEDTIEAIESDIAALKSRVAHLRDLKSRYDTLLEIKHQMLADWDPDRAKRFEALAAQIADHQTQVQAIQEALKAGQTAEQTLARFVDSLRGAQGWGTFDMWAGGLEASLMKHSDLARARMYAQRAQRHLRQFEQELEDMEVGLSIKLPKVKIGMLTTLADFLLDNFVTDWLVQTKIENIRSKAERATRQVRQRLNLLQTTLKATQERLRELEKERSTLLERA